MINSENKKNNKRYMLAYVENMLAHSTSDVKPLHHEEHVLENNELLFFFFCLSLVLQWLLIPNKRLTSDKIHTFMLFFFVHSCASFYYYSFQFTAIRQLACDYTPKKNMLSDDTTSLKAMAMQMIWKTFQHQIRGKIIIQYRAFNNLPKKHFIDDMTYFH